MIKSAFGSLTLGSALLLSACGESESGVCNLGPVCADFLDQTECNGEWVTAPSCESLGYTQICADGTDYKCRSTDTWSTDPAPASGGAGSSGSAGSSSPSSDDDDTSTLCYRETGSGSSQNLQVNCTPDAGVSCSDLGLQASSLVYSSRGVCLDDARKVIEHWQRTGEIGGGSPDLGSQRPGSSAGGSSGGSTLPTSCTGNSFFLPSDEEPPRGNLTVRLNGCFHVGEGFSDTAGFVMKVQGGTCVVGNGSVGFSDTTNPPCNHTSYFKNRIEVFYQYQMVDSPYTRFEARWRPRHEGDSATLTFP